METRNFLEKIENSLLYYARTFLKWLGISCGVGLICGTVGSLFHMAVNIATQVRTEHPWLIFTMPLGGVLIALLYRLLHTEGKGTNNIIDSIHCGDRIPMALVPAIFLSTIITHLCGGSAGREGAALQIGGGIGCEFGKLLHLDEKDMRLVTLCGMSAVFSALFGTPLTASVFSLEVISVGVFYYSGFVPCICASAIAYAVSIAFGLAPTRYAVSAVSLHPVTMVKVGALAVLLALASIAFCEGMHYTERLAGRLRNPCLRAALGGTILLVLTLLMGSQTYNGAGGEVITDAIQSGRAPAWGALWKLLFTAIALGFGFKGGEIVPTFFVGSCLGCVLAPLLGLPAGFGAALGLVGLFCGAVNCPLASILLSVELFGSEGLLYFAVTCGITYMLSGYFGIYRSQKILYSKTRAEYINRFTEE